MDQVDPLREYDWLLMLALVVVATAVLWFRDRTRAKGDRNRQRVLTRRALTFLFWASLPWTVMAVGILSGAMRTSEEFFNPGSGPFSYFWIASMIAVWIACLYWVFAKGGAEEIIASEYLTLAGWPVRRPAHVKLFFIVAVAGGIVGLATLILANWR
jgi:cbb3-type cytochrome oxidase subunit 3